MIGSMGRLARFTTPNAHKRIFLYGNLLSADGPWGEEHNDEDYDERVIIRDTLGIVLKEHMCNKFNVLFYGIITIRGDMGWVHNKNVEFLDENG